MDRRRGRVVEGADRLRESIHTGHSMQEGFIGRLRGILSPSGRMRRRRTILLSRPLLEEEGCSAQVKIHARRRVHVTRCCTGERDLPHLHPLRGVVGSKNHPQGDVTSWLPAQQVLYIHQSHSEDLLAVDAGDLVPNLELKQGGGRRGPGQLSGPATRLERCLVLEDGRQER